MHGVPSADAHQHAVGMLNGVHMAIMLLDHFDRCAHLLGENVNIHPGGEPQRGIGMAEAIGGAGNAARTLAQFGVF